MINSVKQQIVLDAEKLGLRPGDTVLMHSSLKSLGVEGITPKELLDGLSEALAVGAVGSGTLILPALSYEHCNPQNRVFDYYKTPSNVGAIPEYFRTEYPGVLRSLCPTHSCCAIGRFAEEITSTQHLDTTPCGKNSPFRKVRELGGKLLFLGCGTKPNTSMHAVEELVEPDYLWGGEYEYTLYDRDGKEHKMLCKAHGFENVTQRYDRIEELLEGGEIKRGKILGADCVLMDASAVWEKGEKALRNNQHHFIDRYQS